MRHLPPGNSPRVPDDTSVLTWRYKFFYLGVFALEEDMKGL